MNILHSNLSVLKVQDIFKCSILSFVNKCRSNRCPDVFKNYYEIRESHYELRHNGRLEVPAARIDIGQNRCEVKGARLWNEYVNWQTNTYTRKVFVNISMRPSWTTIDICMCECMYMFTVFGKLLSFLYVHNAGMGLSLRHAYIGSCPEKLLTCNQVMHIRIDMDTTLNQVHLHVCWHKFEYILNCMSWFINQSMGAAYTGRCIYLFFCCDTTSSWGLGKMNMPNNIYFHSYMVYGCQPDEPSAYLVTTNRTYVLLYKYQ